MRFRLLHTDHNARAGVVAFAHRKLRTPVFMPVGTQACVKALDAHDLNKHLKPQIILANTYHLYLRPSAETVAEFGGLRGFTGFNGLFLTDSGGFQAFSLKSAKVSETGVKFQSHIDGSAHFFTPQKVIDIQHKLSSDIMMVLDDLPALPATAKRLRQSVERTVRWAQESLIYHRTQQLSGIAAHQNLFTIIQGGTDHKMRAQCAGELANFTHNGAGFDGFAIGGLSVGESSAEMYDTLDSVTPLMPAEKPRYLMGVGTPENIIEGIDRGVDMFDCVLPSRNARNGTLFTRSGKINIKRSIYALDHAPIDAQCGCYTCQKYSRGYINHLFRSGELAYYRLATIHNLHYYLHLTNAAREAISAHKWTEFKRAFYAARSEQKDEG